MPAPSFLTSWVWNRPMAATSNSTAWRTWTPRASVMSSWLSLLSSSRCGSVSSSGTAKNRERRSIDTNARTTSRSAAVAQSTASNTTVVVAPPERGATTNAHQRPSVARPSSTLWKRHSLTSRSTGVAAQSESLMRCVGWPSQITPSSRAVSGFTSAPGSTRANDGVTVSSCSGTSRARSSRPLVRRASPHSRRSART